MAEANPQKKAAEKKVEKKPVERFFRVVRGNHIVGSTAYGKGQEAGDVVKTTTDLAAKMGPKFVEVEDPEKVAARKAKEREERKAAEAKVQ